MKKITLAYMIISILLLIGVVSAFNPFENLENYLNLKYDDVVVIGKSTKYDMNKSNHTAIDITMKGKSYTSFSHSDDYENIVIVNYKNELIIQRCDIRLKALEDKLNITDVTVPQEPETDLYSCSYKESRECLGGLSKLNKNNVSTRCYNIFKLGWSNCNDKFGWKLI